MNDELAGELSLAADPAFAQQLALHLHKFFPEQVPPLNETGVWDIVGQGIKKAADRGIVTKRDVCLFIDYTMFFGREIPDGSIDDGYRAALPDRKTDGSVSPAFIVIGGRKCASTSMCELLDLHPDVYVCRPKEPDFFSIDPIFAFGPAWYEALFRSAGSRVTGEGSTSYSIAAHYPETARRIAERNPGCRLIYMVRHPLRRIESNWREEKKWAGYAGRAFGHTMRDSGLIEGSLYWKQLSRYRNFFPDSQVVFFEEFVAGPNEQLRRCLQHIGVDGAAVIPGTGHARNVSSDWKIETNIAHWLHRLSGAQKLWDVSPEWTRKAVRPLLKRRLFSNGELKPVWDKDVRRAVIEKISKDTEEFLKHCGKAASYWGLDA